MAAPALLARGTGRRKEAVVRVRLIEGTGTFKLNGRPLEDYFPNPAHRRLVTEPLRVTNTLERYDVLANLDGGGVSGQAGALRHAISRALVAGSVIGFFVVLAIVSVALLLAGLQYTLWLGNGGHREVAGLRGQVATHGGLPLSTRQCRRCCSEGTTTMRFAGGAKNGVRIHEKTDQKTDRRKDEARR